LKLATSKGALYQADCLDLLKMIKEDSIDCIFADPPFNLGKDYGTARIQDKFHSVIYMNWTREWLDECVRILKPGGSMFIYHMPHRQLPIWNHLNTFEEMQFRNWIAIKMKNGFPVTNRLHPAHYGLLYFVKKGRKAKFHVVRHPSPICRHCGGLIRDYGGYRKKYRVDSEQIPLVRIADIWDDVSPQIHKKKRPKSINELPTIISERAILLSTNKGDIVLDPFAGGASTLSAAEKHNRYWIGCELGITVHAKRRLVEDSEAKQRKRIPKQVRRVFKS